MSLLGCFLPVAQFALNYLLVDLKPIHQLLHYLLCTEILSLAHFESEYYPA